MNCLILLHFRVEIVFPTFLLEYKEMLGTDYIFCLQLTIPLLRRKKYWSRFDMQSLLKALCLSILGLSFGSAWLCKILKSHLFKKCSLKNFNLWLVLTVGQSLNFGSCPYGLQIFQSQWQLRTTVNAQSSAVNVR